MSWDIVLFNTKQKTDSIEDLDENQLNPIDFCAIFENHFERIHKDDNHMEIRGGDFSISYFSDEEPVSNKLVSLYGEKGLYELVILAKQHNWLIFDTGNGEIIDLENPAKNGYSRLQNYLQHLSSAKEENPGKTE